MAQGPWQIPLRQAPACGASELVAGEDTHADFLTIHVLAGLTARAFGGASAQARPPTHKELLPQLLSPSSIFPSQSLSIPSRIRGLGNGPTDNPVPTATRSRSFAALGLAFFGDRLIGSRDVVDQSVAIVVDAIADLDTCAIIIHDHFGHSGRHLRIKRFERRFNLNPRMIHHGGFCTVFNRCAPSGGRKGSLCGGCACGDFDGSSGGRNLLPRDGLPTRGALCAMNARRMAACDTSDALK